MALRPLLHRLWREWLKPLLVVGLTIGSFRTAVADWNDVPTGSMKPTILEGDRIVVNRLAYDLRVPFVGWRIAELDEPKRGDVVVLRSPEDGTRLVKRVVGLPGDRLSMVGDRLVVNGQPVAYGAPRRQPATGWVVVSEHLAGATHPVMLQPAVRSARTFAPVTVPADSFFVMGDNRDVSYDSRFFGCVPRALILGRAVAVAGSLDPAHHLRPRWDRFGRELH